MAERFAKEEAETEADFHAVIPHLLEADMSVQITITNYTTVCWQGSQAWSAFEWTGLPNGVQPTLAQQLAMSLNPNGMLGGPLPGSQAPSPRGLLLASASQVNPHIRSHHKLLKCLSLFDQVACVVTECTEIKL